MDPPWRAYSTRVYAYNTIRYALAFGSGCWRGRPSVPDTGVFSVALMLGSKPDRPGFSRADQLAPESGASTAI